MTARPLKVSAPAQYLSAARPTLRRLIAGLGQGKFVKDGRQGTKRAEQDGGPSLGRSNVRTSAGLRSLSRCTIAPLRSRPALSCSIAPPMHDVRSFPKPDVG